MYALIATAAGLGFGAWFVLAADASDRARIAVGALLAIAVSLRFVFAQPLAATLLFAAVAMSVLVFRARPGTR